MGDDGRPVQARSILLLAHEVLHAVIEDVRAAVHLIEEPREVLAADFVDDGEEVLGCPLGCVPCHGLSVGAATCAWRMCPHRSAA
mgnify:CR=1 FL=1